MSDYKQPRNKTQKKQILDGAINDTRPNQSAESFRSSAVQEYSTNKELLQEIEQILQNTSATYLADEASITNDRLPCDKPPDQKICRVRTKSRRVGECVDEHSTPRRTGGHLPGRLQRPPLRPQQPSGSPEKLQGLDKLLNVGLQSQPSTEPNTGRSACSSEKEDWSLHSKQELGTSLNVHLHQVAQHRCNIYKIITTKPFQNSRTEVCAADKNKFFLEN